MNRNLHSSESGRHSAGKWILLMRMKSSTTGGYTNNEVDKAVKGKSELDMDIEHKAHYLHWKPALKLGTCVTRHFTNSISQTLQNFRWGAYNSNTHFQTFRENNQNLDES